MKLKVNYTPGAGAAALYVRQRDFDGKFANFATLVWDAAESADTKVFFTEPVPGFFVATIIPIEGSGWPLEVIEAATGLMLFDGETEAVVIEPVIPPTLNEIRAAMIIDHGAGLYGPGIAAEFAIRVTAIVAGSDPAIPIPDVAVTLLNADETVILDQKTTNSLGQVVFSQNAGTYILRHRKAGYSFADDVAEIVAADVVHICEGTVLAYPVNQFPDMQTLHITAKLLGPIWAEGDVVEIYPAAGQRVGTALLGGKALMGAIGADGRAYYDGGRGMPVDFGVSVRVVVGDYFDQTIEIDAALDGPPEKDLSEYLV